jgi:hypothetical protein
MTPRGHCLLALILVLVWSVSAQAAEEAYTLKVHRVARVGDVYAVHLVLDQTRTQTLTPRVAASRPATASAPAETVGRSPEQTLKADLDCRVEVVAINLRGEFSLWITVNKFLSLKDQKEMVPAGTVIGVQTDSGDVSLVRRDGGELSADARAVLQRVHPLEYQLDEVSHGSKTPRKAGESWSVDALSVSQMDSNVAYLVDASTVKGKVTLVGAEKKGATPALRLTVDMTHSGQDRYRQPNGNLIERQILTTKLDLLYPLDPTLPPLETQSVTDTVATGRRVADKTEETAFEVKTHTVEKQTITLVQK